MGDRARAMRWALVLLAVLAPLSASAHGFEVGALALDELEPGRFAVAWRAPEDSRRVTPARVTIRFPAHCRRQHHELHCGSEGLHGTIAFDDLPDPRTTIAVRIDRLDGRHLEAMVRGDSPVLDVGRASTTFAAFEEAARRVLSILAGPGKRCGGTAIHRGRPPARTPRLSAGSLPPSISIGSIDGIRPAAITSLGGIRCRHNAAFHFTRRHLSGSNDLFSFIGGTRSSGYAALHFMGGIPSGGHAAIGCQHGRCPRRMPFFIL